MNNNRHVKMYLVRILHIMFVYRFNSDDENVEPVFVLNRDQEQNNNLPNDLDREDPSPVPGECL